MGVEPAWSHDMHAVGEFVHVAQVELHALQAFVVLGTRNSPIAHAYVQEADASSVPPEWQDVQLAAVPLVHSAQLESQLVHTFDPSAKVPNGHAATHAPPSKYGVPEAGQLRQAVLPGPLHSLQVAAQAVQTARPPMISENVPS